MLDIEKLTYRFAVPERKWSLFPGLTGRSSLSRTDPATVLNELNLQVNDNELLVILGPSGSGKTTLLRSIAGLIRPDSGTITIHGENVTQKAPHQRGVSFVFQNGGWYDHLTVEQNLRLDGATSKEVDAWLERLGLATFQRKFPNELSGGQAQRLAIGRAMAKGNSLILMDEPLNQLDERLRESIRELIRELHRDGKTIVYVTHDQYDAMQLATRLAILYNGRVQQIGSIEELYRHPNHLSVAMALGQPPMQFFEFTDSANNGSCNLVQIKRQLDLSEICGSVSLPAHRNRSDGASRSIAGIRPEAWQTTLLDNIDPHKRECFPIARMSTQRFLGDKVLQTWLVEPNGFPPLEIQRLANNQETTPISTSYYTLIPNPKQLHFFDLDSGNRCHRID
jgi:ABC-type sugar transport system ATPase subunit